MKTGISSAVWSNIIDTRLAGFTNWLAAAGIPIDDDYQALLEYWLSKGYMLPTFSHQIAQNNLLRTLKNIGVWDKMDIFYVLANDNRDIARTNWKSPGSFDCTEVNWPLFTASQGFASELPAGGWLTTGYNPAVDGVNYTLNDASAYVYPYNIPVVAGGWWYVSNSSTLAMSRGVSNVNKLNWTTGFSGPEFGTDAGEIKGMDRSDSVFVRTYAGSSFVLRGNASNTLATGVVDILTANGAAPFTGKIAMTMVGGSIEGMQWSFNTAMQTYMAAIQVEDEYQDILDYWASQGYDLPSGAAQVSQNTLVKDLKDAGVWGKLDTFYVMANENREIAKTNWSNPGNFDLTEVDIPEFTINQGFSSDGVSSYLETWYNALADWVNFQLNDASLGYRPYDFWSSTNTWVMWWIDLKLRKSTIASQKINSTLSTSDPAYAANPWEIKALWRKDANNVGKVFGETVVPATLPSLAVVNSTLPLLRANNSTSFFEDTMAMAFYGGNFEGLESEFNTAMQNYMATLEFEPEYVQALDYAITQGYELPSHEVQIAQNKAIKRLILSGIWDTYDLFYLLASDSREFSKINLKSPNTFYLGESWANLDFIIGKGFSAPIDSSSLVTNYTAANDAVNYQVNNVGAYCRPLTTAPANFEYAFGDNRTTMAIANSVWGNRVTSLSAFGFSQDLTIPNQLKGLQRVDSANISFIDGDAIYSRAAASLEVGQNQMRILRSVVTSATSFTGRMCMFSVGGAIPGLEATYNDIMKEYTEAVNYIEPEYQTILDYWESVNRIYPNAKVQRAQNTLIREMKEAGIWQKMDVFHVMATGTAGQARTNFIDPNNFELTEVNGPTFTANQGYVSDGVSSYLNTSYTPSSDGTNYTLNDASLGVYSYDSPAGVYWYAGANNGSRIGKTSGTIQQINNTSGFGDASFGADTVGLKAVWRSDSTSVATVVGDTIVPKSLTSNFVPTVNMHVLSTNGGSTYSTSTLSFHFIGGSIEGDEATFNRIMQNYIAAIA